MDEVSPVATKPIRVLIVDDHEVSREGLALMMEQLTDFQVVGVATNGTEAIARVQALEGAVDVIVMDLQMDTPTEGIDATTMLSATYPACRIMMLTYSESQHYATAARRAGALGFVKKVRDVNDIFMAIRVVHHGTMYYEVVPDDAIVLTETETRILELIANGLSNGEISQQLICSTSTVGSHITNIYRKLGIKTREQAVRAGMRLGIIH